MKIKFIFIIMVYILIGCNKSRYYEKPINDWMFNNLDDYSSYEPVQFTILTDIRDYLVSYRDYNLSFNEKFRIISELLELFEEKENVDRSAVLQISENLEVLQKFKNNDSIFSLHRIDSLFSLIDSSMTMLESVMPKSFSPVILYKSYQYRSNSKEYNLAIQAVKEELKVLNTDFVTLDHDLKQGLIISHKYRAKNNIGAMILNFRLFKINIENGFVVGTYTVNNQN
jgi:hypothetical protein